MALHVFDTQIAGRVGIESAILYSNIAYWCEHNKANDIHYHDGYYWTYNSIKAYRELFPYMAEKTIIKALKRLCDNDYILIGSYNSKPYDRTKWYAIKSTENMRKPLQILNCPNGQMDLPKRANGNARTGKPIPDNKPNNNKPNIYSKNRFNALEQIQYDFEELERNILAN